MAIKHAKFTLLFVFADDKNFFAQWIVSFAVKLGSFDLRNLLNWWNIEFDNIFLWKINIPLVIQLLK